MENTITTSGYETIQELGGDGNINEQVKRKFFHVGFGKILMETSSKLI
jgi:hypothetical protein